jgi:hypothetical protein
VTGSATVDARSSQPSKSLAICYGESAAGLPCGVGFKLVGVWPVVLHNIILTTGNLPGVMMSVALGSASTWRLMLAAVLVTITNQSGGDLQINPAQAPRVGPGFIK